jgi:hypothetical protein
MQANIPHWKLKGDQYIYTKNSGFKIIAYSIAIVMLLIALAIIKSLIGTLISGKGFTSTGDLIATIIAAILLLLIGYMLFSSANKNDKYIDLKNQTLNLKSGKTWKAIPFSQITAIVPIDKYINNRFHGTFYCYLLNGQNEPVRNQQEISDHFYEKATQQLFYTNMKSLLEIKD